MTGIVWEAPQNEGTGGVEGDVLRQRLAALEQELARRERDEQALRQQVAELEARNAELEAQNADLEAFAGTVAHDLKNPLGVIVSYTSLLRWCDSERAVREMADVLPELEQHARAALGLVDDLMLLAQARAGRAPAPQPVALAPCVGAALLRLRPLIAATGAQISQAESWPEVNGFGPWVEAVWVNYLSNAIKYGGRPPRLSIGAEVRADGQVYCWVRDNGSGIDPAQRERLFQPFERLHNGEIEGHGLGLTIVRRLVEALGGEVGLESELGAGTTFFFTLPQATALSVGQTSAAEPALV
ncbi:MAG TPA: HAMP domain-containing sensor histidine kinase [Roseiflexaceae bacterium]|nr:HAMP domain-containing sensor histidine kinase [Roseiflexaceae bacterium]